jgi:putative effector of murein hydrolase LrgA (UPF0299 family)
MYWPHLVEQGIAIVAALVASVLATIAVSALIAKALAPRDSDAA